MSNAPNSTTTASHLPPESRLWTIAQAYDFLIALAQPERAIAKGWPHHTAQEVNLRGEIIAEAQALIGERDSARRFIAEFWPKGYAHEDGLTVVRLARREDAETERRKLGGFASLAGVRDTWAVPLVPVTEAEARYYTKGDNT